MLHTDIFRMKQIHLRQATESQLLALPSSNYCLQWHCADRPFDTNIPKKQLAPNWSSSHCWSPVFAVGVNEKLWLSGISCVDVEIFPVFRQTLWLLSSGRMSGISPEDGNNIVCRNDRQLWTSTRHVLKIRSFKLKLKYSHFDCIMTQNKQSSPEMQIPIYYLFTL
jgi:hypothetical protein